MSKGSNLVLATVTAVKDNKVVYPCCGGCYSKLLDDKDHGSWWCSRCQKEFQSETVDWRYRLSLCISDSMIVTNVCAFGGMLEKFFGPTATKFNKYYEKLKNDFADAEYMLLQALEITFVGKLFYFGFRMNHTVHDSSEVSLKQIIKSNSHIKSNGEIDDLVSFHIICAENGDSAFYTVADVIRDNLRNLCASSTPSKCQKNFNKLLFPAGRDSFLLKQIHVNSAASANDNSTFTSQQSLLLQSFGSDTLVLSCDNAVDKSSNSCITPRIENFREILLDKDADKTYSSPLFQKLSNSFSNNILPQPKNNDKLVIGKMNLDTITANDNADLHDSFISSANDSDLMLAAYDLDEESAKKECTSSSHSFQINENVCETNSRQENMKECKFFTGSINSVERKEKRQEMASKNWGTKFQNCSSLSDNVDELGQQRKEVAHKYDTINLPESEDLFAYLDDSLRENSQLHEDSLENMKNGSLDCTNMRKCTNICSKDPARINDLSQSGVVVIFDNSRSEETYECEKGTCNVERLESIHNCDNELSGKKVICTDKTFDKQKDLEKDVEILDENLAKCFEEELIIQSPESKIHNSVKSEAPSKFVNKENKDFKEANDRSVAFDDKFDERLVFLFVKDTKHKTDSDFEDSNKLDSSEDLFGSSVNNSCHETSCVESSQKGNEFKIPLDIDSKNEVSDRGRSVHFARRLSCMKSVELIDIEMRVKPLSSSSVPIQKPCLKSSTSQLISPVCKAHVCMFSPILSQTDSIIASQDLFGNDSGNQSPLSATINDLALDSSPAMVSPRYSLMTSSQELFTPSPLLMSSPGSKQKNTHMLGQNLDAKLCMFMGQPLAECKHDSVVRNCSDNLFKTFQKTLLQKRVSTPIYKWVSKEMVTGKHNNQHCCSSHSNLSSDSGPLFSQSIDISHVSLGSAMKEVASASRSLYEQASGLGLYSEGLTQTDNQDESFNSKNISDCENFVEAGSYVEHCLSQDLFSPEMYSTGDSREKNSFRQVSVDTYKHIPVKRLFID